MSSVAVDRPWQERRSGPPWVLPVVFAAGAVAALWPFVFGSLSEAFRSPAELCTGLGRLTGMAAGYLIPVQLILMSRVGLVDRMAGTHRGSSWHKWIGRALLPLVIVHLVFITLGYAGTASEGILTQSWSLIRNYAWVLAAWVATLLLTMVVLTSLRILKRYFRYETWLYLHLYAHLAAALGFMHQIQISADLDGGWRTYWIVFYVAAFAMALWGRLLAPLLMHLRHRFQVTRVVAEAPRVSSIYISGDRVSELGARPGQFLRFRFLTRHGWWQAHPFSLSAPPSAAGLRITVKALGDHTEDIQEVRPGTAVVVDGPYGGFLAQRRRNDDVLLLAAGIGITPIRALLEDLPPGRAVMIYRADQESDLVFRAEIDDIAAARGFKVVYLVGRDVGDALTPDGLRRLVPDIGSRDVFMCGPPGLMNHLHGVLHRLGIPRQNIHLDPFEM